MEKRTKGRVKAIIYSYFLRLHRLFDAVRQLNRTLYLQRYTGLLKRKLFFLSRDIDRKAKYDILQILYLLHAQGLNFFFSLDHV